MKNIPNMMYISCGNKEKIV